MSESNTTFEDVKLRLDEILDAVNADGISLDAALDLYEEAVKLGMQASTLLEEGIAEQTNEKGESDASEVVVAQAESADVGPESVIAEEGVDGISLQQ